MNKKNILKKVLLFIVGAFVVWLLIELIFDWRGSLESFKKGFNETSATRIEVIK